MDFISLGLIVIDNSSQKFMHQLRPLWVAPTQEIPYMVVIGDKEKDSATVAPLKSNVDQLSSLSVGAFVDKIKEECGPQWGL